MSVFECVSLYSQRLKMYKVVEVAGVNAQKGIVGDISATGKDDKLGKACQDDV